MVVTDDRHIETQLLHIQPADHLELADVQKKKCLTQISAPVNQGFGKGKTKSDKGQSDLGQKLVEKQKRTSGQAGARISGPPSCSSSREPC